MAVRNQYAKAPGYGEETYFSPRRAKPPSEARAPKAAGDTLILSLLFIVAPLCGFIGLFVDAFLWVFAIVSVLIILAMWAIRCFEPRGRAFLSGVLVVFIGVALVRSIFSTPSSTSESGTFPVYGDVSGNAFALQAQGIAEMTGDTGTAQQPAIAGTEVETPPPPAATPTLSSKRVMPVGVSEASIEEQQVAATVPPLQQQATETSAEVVGGGQTAPATEAEQVLDKYLSLWREKNFEGMVQYTMKSWQQQLKTPPSRQLSYEHTRWEIQRWTMTPQPASSSANVAVIVVEADLRKGTADQTAAYCRYTVEVHNENGGWYVDPDTLRGSPQPLDLINKSEEAEPETDEQPSTEPTVRPSLQLWYNPDGGSKYHLEQKCQDINPKYYTKMKSFEYSEIGEHSKLRPCSTCEAPKRPKD